MKTMKISTVLVISTFLFCAGAAFAETYKWVDESGNAHYTDDFTKIPERYRSTSKRVEGEEEPLKKGADSAVTKEAPVTDRLGRGEDYWKNRVEELKKKIKNLEEKDHAFRVKYNELTIKFNDSKNSIERANLRLERDQVKSDVDRNKAELDEAKIELEKKIPEEAQLFRARPDWIK